MKRILSALLTTAMLFGLIVPFGALTVSAKSKYKRSGDWQYIDTAQGVVLTRCYAETETVETPNSINGKKVVAIDALWKPLFSSNIVKKLIIGDSIKWVNAYVFYNNNLNTIKLGKNVKTFLTKPYYENFSGGEVDYSDYFLQEKPYAFCKRILVAKDNPYFTSKDGVLYDKRMETLIKYPSDKTNKSFIVPKTVRKIGTCAFAWAKFSTIKLNKKLEKIGNQAFVGSNLKKIKCSKNLIRIGKRAFDNCKNLTTFKANKKLAYVESNSFIRTPIWEQQKKGAVYADNVFLDWKGDYTKMPKCLKIKEGTRVIANNAVDASYLMEQYEIPKSARLETVILPQSVRYIGEYAFWDINLKKVKMGDKIISVGAGAFRDAPKRKQNGVRYYKDIAFGKSSNQVKEITVKRGIRIIADSAFNEGWYTDVDIEIEKLKRLVSIKLPSGLKTIGNEAFYGCKKLEKLTIPKSVTYIGKNAFKDTDIKFTVYKGSYAHKYLKKNGYKKIVVKE